MISNSHIIPGFGNDQYLVKWYFRPNDLPDFVCVRDNVVISCDNNFPKHNKEGFCGQTIGVALKCKLVEKYTAALSKCQERTVTQLALQNIKPRQVSRKRSQCIRNSVKENPEKRFRNNRSNSTSESKRVVSTTKIHPTLLFSGRATSPPSLSTSQNELHGRTFLQEVLNPQPTVFDITGQPVASQEDFNGPLKGIKNDFITLLSSCDKRLSICCSCTHELKHHCAIPPPLFDLVVVTKM